jgi:hypothetical protein
MIDKDKINGKGSLLWSVILIDQSDPEDSSVAFWLADNIDDLYEQIKEDWDMDESMEDQFEQDWGYYILPEVIGTAS